MNVSGRFGSAVSLQATPVTVVLLAVNVLMWVALEATGGSQNSENLVRFGAKFGPAIALGEWWRLVMPMFLHIGFFHLLANSFGLFIFGGMVERIFGSFAFAAIYLVGGVLGNLFSYWADIGIYHSTPIGAGASGAVFGIVGAFGSYLLLNRHVLGQMGRQAMMSVLFIVGINFIFGITLSGVDNMAHLGGLFGGALLGFGHSPHAKPRNSRLRAGETHGVRADRNAPSRLASNGHYDRCLGNHIDAACNIDRQRLPRQAHTAKSIRTSLTRQRRGANIRASRFGGQVYPPARRLNGTTAALAQPCGRCHIADGSPLVLYTESDGWR